MKRCIIIILSMVSIVSYAQQSDTLFNSANNDFKQGDFQEATAKYEKILDQGYESSELYFNLANAYYKQNVVAKAILNYERALQLKPNDQDIKYNLELANRLVVDKIEVLPVFFLTAWIRGVKNIFSSDRWAIISIISFIVSLFFISMYLFTRSVGVKKLSFWIAFIVFVVTVISFIFSYQQKQKLMASNTAIIINPSVTVKSSPDASGNDLFVLHEGTKVWLEDKISDWNEIKLSDGSKGWIKTEEFEVI